jgi:hypothetical protein
MRITFAADNEQPLDWRLAAKFGGDVDDAEIYLGNVFVSDTALRRRQQADATLSLRHEMSLSPIWAEGE